MACPFNKESLAQLKSFVDICKSKPEILQIPQLNFFKIFIESLGGTIPEAKIPQQEHKKTENAEPEPKLEEVESDPESDLEVDMEGCVTPDEVNASQDMGDESKQPTEEDMDKADEVRGSAMAQFQEGNFEKALELYTEAIGINPQSAILFTKRGQVYIKMDRPNACIKDCTHALELNCDSAPAYKFRGRAHRLIGEWEKAAQDLRQACKIDCDEQANDWLKEVQPNALKIEQHNLRKERKKLDKAEKERAERLKRAKDAHAKAAENNAAKPDMPDIGDATTGGGGGPGMGDFYNIMQDPEIIAAFQDPEVAAAFQDISTNPANIMKYQSNPKVQALIDKLSSKFSGGGGLGGAMGGMGFPGFGGAGGQFPGFPSGMPTSAVPEEKADDGLD